jgi:hypothetical protein
MVLWVCRRKHALAVFAIQQAVPGGFEEGACDAVDFTRCGDVAYVDFGWGDADDGA